jgi:hypothetical protein
MNVSTETEEPQTVDQECDAKGLVPAESSPPTDRKPLELANERSECKPSEANQKIATAPGSNGSKTRSLIVRDKSKYNALKHGIFSDVVVLSFESKSQFESLLRGFLDDRKPVGTLEETLVSKLATITWRHRRLLQAEGAAVQKSIQLGQAAKGERIDRGFELEATLDECLAQTDRAGLISRINDPSALEACLACLDRLYGIRKELQIFGLDHDGHGHLLGRVYGARFQGRKGKDLFELYRKCLYGLKASAEERKRIGFEEDCFQRFKEGLESQIQQLESLRKSLPSLAEQNEKTDDTKLTQVELSDCVVPRSRELDRLLRYEASLERSFDRTLGQLERLQRTRKGEPVAPPIDMHMHVHSDL